MIDEHAPRTRLPALESVVFGVVQGTLLLLIALACIAGLLLAVYGVLRLWGLVQAAVSALPG